MAYDPVNNEQLVESQAEVFRDISEFLTELTANEVLDGNTNAEYLSSVESWLQFKQKSYQKLFEEAAKQADKAIAAIPTSITNAVEIAYSIGEQTAAAELLAAGITPDVSGGFQTLSQYALDSLMDAAINRMGNRVNKLNIVNGVQDAFREATESAAALVLSGGATLEDATEIAVNSLLDKGLKTINVGNRKMGIDAYAETSIRTIAGNAQVQGSIDRYEDADQYLSFVTDSPMECDLCRPYEGKVIRTTNDLEKIPPKFHEVPSLDTAKADGLFHPNCTHSLQVYIDGYSEPPTDTDDSVNGDRRSKIRRLQKLEKTNRLKEKIYRENGSKNRAAGAKKRAAKYKAERRRLENLLERNSLGWFTGEQRLRRLAESVNIPVEVLDKAKGNLPQLNKLVSQAGGFTGIDPRLISPQVRADVAAVLEPPNIKDYGVDSFDKLTVQQQKDLRYAFYKFYEADVGVMNYLEDNDSFHKPPPLPKEVKSKKQFDDFVSSRSGTKHYSNDYGQWQWDNNKGKPVIAWQDDLKEQWADTIDRKILEQKAAGARTDGQQVIAGGLPSSGKTFTLANKGKVDSIRTYNLDDYVILNTDDFKTEIIIRDYASKIDKNIDKKMSELFIAADATAAGSKLEKSHPLYKLINATHPDIAKDILNKDFSKDILTEVREAIVARTPIGNTGLFGFEAANIIHSESSAMLKVATDEVGKERLNIIHDVTLGSKRPIEAATKLIEKNNYAKADVMFINFTKEQAVDSVVDRYIKGNFNNVLTTGRGGRYVTKEVLDGMTSKINKTDSAGKQLREKTLDLLGREAMADNEGFLVDLLESDIISEDLEDIQIINRYSEIDPSTGQAIPQRIDLEIKDGKIVAKRAARGADGLKVKTSKATQKVVRKNNVPTDRLDEMIDYQTNADGSVNQAYLAKIEARKALFKSQGLKPDDAPLYIIAEQQGFTGKPKTLPTMAALQKNGVRSDYQDINIVNNKLDNDVVVLRGLSDQVDVTSERVAQRTKTAAAKRLDYISNGFAPSDNVPYVEERGLVFYKSEDFVKELKKHVSDQNIVGFDLELIDADALDEAFERFGVLNDSDYNKKFIMPPKGYIEQSMFSHPMFRDIYDDVLFELELGVQEVKRAPILKTGLQMHEEFINGEFYAGFGVYGQGTYTDIDISVAVQYANQFGESEGYGEGGVVQAILLPKGIRMPSDEVLQKVAKEAHEARMGYYDKFEMKGRYSASNTKMYREANALVEVDIGRRLTAMGYQAYPVKPLDGSKNHVVILDRTAVTVAEAPVYIDGKLNS